MVGHTQYHRLGINIFKKRQDTHSHTHTISRVYLGKNVSSFYQIRLTRVVLNIDYWLTVGSSVCVFITMLLTHSLRMISTNNNNGIHVARISTKVEP